MLFLGCTLLVRLFLITVSRNLDKSLNNEQWRCAAELAAQQSARALLRYCTCRLALANPGQFYKTLLS